MRTQHAHDIARIGAEAEQLGNQRVTELRHIHTRELFSLRTEADKVRQECKDAVLNLDVAISEKSAKEQQTFLDRKAIHEKTTEALLFQSEILKLQTELAKSEKKRR